MNKNGDPTSIDLVYSALQVGVFGGIPASITYWLFDDPTIGAVFGIGTYLALLGATVVQDVANINKNMTIKKNED